MRILAASVKFFRHHLCSSCPHQKQERIKERMDLRAEQRAAYAANIKRLRRLRLAAALAKMIEDGGNEMADKAATGYYDDYESPLDFPVLQLVADLGRSHKRDARELAQRVKDGEFDATADEGDIWYAKEGQHFVNPEMAEALGFPKIGEH